MRILTLFKPLVISIIFSFALLRVAVDSKSFHDCFQREKLSDDYKSVYQAQYFFQRSSSRVNIHAVCVSEFIDHNHESINTLATIVIAAFTLTLWLSTHRLWLAARGQSIDMQKSISEAARAATAMESLASAMLQNITLVTKVNEINAKIADQQNKLWPMQMRAYISVTIGGAVYQDKNHKFEGKPVFVNTGNTPAYNVRHEIKAAILPQPVPDDFDFSVEVSQTHKGTVVAQNQNRIMGFIIDRIYTQDEVDAIKTGKDHALCVWGKITYNDAFGEARFTTFCQVLVWHSDETVMGYYLPNYSESN